MREGVILDSTAPHVVHARARTDISLSRRSAAAAFAANRMGTGRARKSKKEAQGGRPRGQESLLQPLLDHPKRVLRKPAGDHPAELCLLGRQQQSERGVVEGGGGGGGKGAERVQGDGRPGEEMLWPQLEGRLLLHDGRGHRDSLWRYEVRKGVGGRGGEAKAAQKQSKVRKIFSSRASSCSAQAGGCRGGPLFTSAWHHGVHACLRHLFHQSRGIPFQI